MPWGYRYNSVTGFLDVNPHESPLVPVIFDLYLNRRLGANNVAGPNRESAACWISRLQFADPVSISTHEEPARTKYTLERVIPPPTSRVCTPAAISLTGTGFSPSKPVHAPQPPSAPARSTWLGPVTEPGSGPAPIPASLRPNDR